MTAIYLAGPMTGYPDWNYPLFHRAAAELRSTGATVVNPAEQHDPAANLKSWEFYMREGLRAMLCCDRVVLLQGWESSRGARLEAFLANIIGIPVCKYSAIGRIEYSQTGCITAGRGGQNA